MTKVLSIMFLIAVMAVSSFAGVKQKMNISVGDTKTVDRTGVKIKFVSVHEGRCPPNAKCITAGNAEVKLVVWKGRAKAVSIDLNTDTGAKDGTAYGYRFSLTNLTFKNAATMGIRDRPLEASLVIEKIS